MAKGGRPPWRRALRNLPRSRSGNVATITALLMPVALALAAVAVDEGSLYVQRRHIQNLTDLAAIAAASDIGHAGEAANALLKANGVTDLTLIDEADQGPAAANTLLVQPRTLCRRSRRRGRRTFPAGRGAL